MKAGKAPAVVVEMLRATGNMGATMICDLAAAIILLVKVQMYSTVDGLIRQLVSIDDSIFGFVPGRGTTDAFFVVRQLQEKYMYLAANKWLYMVFRRPGEGIWLNTSEGHLVGAEKTWCGVVDCATGAGDVCKCAEPCLCWWGYSEEFEVKVSVHQGSVLIQLLFIFVLEALPREFRSGIPWEDLYADDLVIIAELLKECVRRLLT